jgi:hypothetical protein
VTFPDNADFYKAFSPMYHDALFACLASLVTDRGLAFFPIVK